MRSRPEIQEDVFGIPLATNVQPCVLAGYSVFYVSVSQLIIFHFCHNLCPGLSEFWDFFWKFSTFCVAANNVHARELSYFG